MRICMISGSYPPMPDGVGDYTRRVLLELRRRLGDDSVYLVGPALANPADQGPGLSFSIPKWSLAGCLSVVKQVKAIRPDVINIQYQTLGYQRSFGANLMPFLLRRFGPAAPIVVTLHEFSSRTAKGKLRILVSLLSSDRIVVVNRQYITEIAGWAPWLRGRMQYVPIGANLLPQPIDPELLNALRRRWGISPAQPVLMYFGVLRKNKGIESLLEAFALFHKKRPDAKLLVVGYFDQDYFDSSIKAIVESRGLGDHVAFTGGCSELELSHYFAMAHFCVLPFPDGVSSKRGSFMAALQHEMPIVTNAPRFPYPELKNGENILFAASGEPRDLADSMEKLLGDDELRDRLGRNIAGLKREYSWEPICDQLLAVFEECRGKEFGVR